MTLSVLTNYDAGGGHSALFPFDRPPPQPPALLHGPARQSAVPELHPPSELGLAELWAELLSGGCFVEACQFSPSDCQATLRFRTQPGDRRVCGPRARKVVERVLLGESQNAVALDFGIAASTVTTICEKVLSAVGFERRPSRAPLLLVLCVHAAHGYRLRPARMQSSIEDPSVQTLSLERPDRTLPAVLSPAEKDIVRCLMESWSYSAIAQARESSLRTVANQVASVFRKLRTSGRSALRAELVRRHAVPGG